MTDHYGEAIAAGAAALAKPYREPETIRAFTDEYPTLAAARVLDAALPHMRAAIIAEGITPGPCPAIKPIPPLSSNGPQNLYGLCDLRAGHTGQHEVISDEYGEFRWTDDAPAGADIPADTQCSERIQFTPTDLRVCERRTGHGMYHIDGQLVWCDRRGILLAPAMPTTRNEDTNP